VVPPAGAKRLPRDFGHRPDGSGVQVIEFPTSGLESATLTGRVRKDSFT
jgi:hypothetical protein